VTPAVSLGGGANFKFWEMRTRGEIIAGKQTQEADTTALFIIHTRPPTCLYTHTIKWSAYTHAYTLVSCNAHAVVNWARCRARLPLGWSCCKRTRGWQPGPALLPIGARGRRGQRNWWERHTCRHRRKLARHLHLSATPKRVCCELACFNSCHLLQPSAPSHSPAIAWGDHLPRTPSSQGHANHRPCRVRHLAGDPWPLEILDGLKWEHPIADSLPHHECRCCFFLRLRKAESEM
jgi:hypothetical protein